jgi:hypothetical protein
MPLFTGVRGKLQPVEKVGAELTVTTNRAPEAPRSPQHGALGAHSGVEAAIEGVFQQAGQFCELRVYGVLGPHVSLPDKTSGTYLWLPCRPNPLDRGSDTFSEVIGASVAGFSEDVPLGDASRPTSKYAVATVTLSE